MREDFFDIDVDEIMSARYLQKTGQTDDSALRVFDYYCAITSLVGAIMESFEKTGYSDSFLIEADKYLDRVNKHVSVAQEEPDKKIKAAIAKLSH